MHEKYDAWAQKAVDVEGKLHRVLSPRRPGNAAMPRLVYAQTTQPE
jgi:hypothetical protein